MMTILKGLPLSYFKDLQEDKKIVFETFDNLTDSLKVLNEVLKNFSVNKKEMLKLANKGYITATDLADYLVKNLNYPFRKSYQMEGCSRRNDPENRKLCRCCAKWSERCSNSRWKKTPFNFTRNFFR